MFWIRTAYALAIRAAGNVRGQGVDLCEFDAAVLAPVAYYQLMIRDGLKDMLGREISRELIGTCKPAG